MKKVKFKKSFSDGGWWQCWECKKLIVEAGAENFLKAFREHEKKVGHKNANYHLIWPEVKKKKKKK